MWKGAADRWGMAAAFPPDALPLHAVAATRRRPPQRPYVTPRSNVEHKLSVRKRTCTAHAWCSRTLVASSLADHGWHAPSQTSEFLLQPTPRAHPTAARLPFRSSFLRNIASHRPARSLAFRASAEVTASCAPNPARNEDSKTPQLIDHRRQALNLSLYIFCAHRSIVRPPPWSLVCRHAAVDYQLAASDPGRLVGGQI